MDRWRDRPRRTLWRWDLERGFVPYAIFWGAAWVGVFSNLYDAVAPGGSPVPETLLTAAICLAVAVAMTWLAVLYLRRPVLPRPARDRGGDPSARDESEARAWRNR